MWWKLSLLGLVTIVLVAIALPTIQTHAVKYDAYKEPPPQTWSAAGLLKAFNWTPTNVALIATIPVSAVAIGFWIVRTSR